MRRRPTFLLTITERDAGRRLDKLLVDRLGEHFAPAEVSRSRVKDLLDRGAIHVDGRRVRVASRTLEPGARLEVFAHRDEICGTREVAPAWELAAERILYEDDDLIAVDKPPGVRTQGTVADARDNLFEAVRRFLRARDGEGAYVALHHRLDREASGVVVMARSVRANSGLAAIFRERTATEKRYRALCWRPVDDAALPSAPWTLEGPLRRPGPVGNRDDGRFAHSELRLLAVGPRGIECEVEPHTGRRHQVRLHLAMSELPILGDRQYGPPGAPCGITVPRLMLHAWRLGFAHPVTGRALVLESPLPHDYRAVREALGVPVPEVHSGD